MFNWPFIIRCATFGFLSGIYSLAATKMTVGFKFQTVDDLVNLAALFVIAFVGGIGAYRIDPEKAWGRISSSK